MNYRIIKRRYNNFLMINQKQLAVIRIKIILIPDKIIQDKTKRENQNTTQDLNNKKVKCQNIIPYTKVTKENQIINQINLKKYIKSMTT